MAPIFICGALRSGSSLTHVILDHHPEIKNPGEFDFLFDQVSDDGQFPEINSYHDWLSKHRIFQSKSLSIDYSLAYLDLIHSFIKQLIKKDGVLALNVHRGFDRIPFLFPEAKFIHLIRDPRDVARSSIGMGWAGNLYYGVDHWLQTEQAWNRLRAKILVDQCIEIKFEDLITSTKDVLKEICFFVGVSYSDKMLNYADKSTYKSPDPSLVRQWETKLTIRDIQYVESKAHSLMRVLGYDLSEYPLIKIGVLEKFWLKLSNKIFKIKFTINRYGIFLYCKEVIARYFKLEKLHKEVIMEKNKISEQYLK